MSAKLPNQSIAYGYQTHDFALTLHLPTRLDAEIAYLRAACPELADKVERLSVNAPELATRARRAGFLVLDGAVRLAESDEIMTSNGRYHRTAAVLAYVRAEDGQSEYLLTLGDFGVVICNCPDANPEPGEEGAPWTRIAQHTCKHILAASFLASK